MKPQDPTPEQPQAPSPPTPDTVIAPTVPVETENVQAAVAVSDEPPAPAPADPKPVASGTTSPQAAGRESQTVPAKPAPKPDEAPTVAKPQLPDPKSHVPNTLPVTEPGEHTVCVVKRHPVGILGTYVIAGVALIVTAAFAFMVVPDFIKDKGQATAAGGLLFVIVAVVCSLFLLIARKVYWGNSWTVTSDSLTQVSRLGLFSRQSSQLSLRDLEDVTAAQDGVLARMLNYGVLRVETAGERSKFVFPFCPNPNYYAQQILTAREAFERNRTAEETPGPEQKTP